MALVGIIHYTQYSGVVRAGDTSQHVTENGR